MKERIVQRFNKGAETYDSACLVQARIADRLLQLIPRVSAQNILEIGCGTGLFSQVIAAEFPKASFLLTDISPVMVNTCKKRFASYPQMQFACVDGEKLPFSSVYDLIVSNMTLHWFTDIKNSFAKIIDRLAPGGRFTFAMLGENSLAEWRDVCQTLGLPIATPHFPMISVLQNTFKDMQFKVETLTQQYSNIYDFLRSLKKIGATASRENYKPMSALQLRRILRKFAEPINISYEVIYGEFVKS